MKRQPTEINHDLVHWVKQNLNVRHTDENYYRMISGADYDPITPDLVRDRILSSEQTADYYQQLRLKDFASVEDLVAARSQIIASLFGACGPNVYIEPPFYVDYGYNIKVGKNFYANFNATFLDCSIISIGDNVLFGPNVTVTTASHPLEAEARNSGVEYAQPIRIGNNVWIGSNVVILPGVTIGDNAVVGAGAVVSKDVPESMLALGIPARPVKKIDQGGATQ